MSLPISQAALGAINVHVMNELRKVHPAWLDSKEIQSRLPFGRGVGVSLKFLFEDGHLDRAKWGNIYVYRQTKEK